MRETETRLSKATSLGVWSSGKDSTRRYRMDFYLGQLTKAKLEVCHYEAMVRLEEQKADLRVRSFGPVDVECDALAAQIRLLRLQEQAQTLRDAVCGKGKVADSGGEEEEEEEEKEAEGTEVESLSELGCERAGAGVSR